jgi:hypothetical protein
VANGKVQLFPLDEHGERRDDIDVIVTRGVANIELKPECETVWYELVIGP